MKIHKIIGTTLLVLAPLATCTAKNISLTKTQLLDKIKGGWAGQTIGCTFGGPTEFKYCGKIIPDTTKIAWPEHYCKWWYDNTPGLYDDVYMDLTFVDVFAKKGLDAPVEDFANAFAYAKFPLWCANQQGRYNILNGISPSESGHWKHNPHADDLDFQIEADFSGLMAPGMPNAAAHFGDKIGHMMCYGDGWYGGVYVGAMYSLAFVSNDINYVVKEALKMIPQQSKFYKCMADVITWYEQNPNDWKKTWQLLENKYGKEKFCPGTITQANSIDAKMNSAYVIMGLLYGQGDYTTTMEVSTRCGQDSDCNPSTAGGILGTMIGYSNIPEYWMKPLREVEDMNFAYTDISLNKAYQMSFDQACQVIKRYGGKVTDKKVSIKVQKPLSVRFEQSFEGLKAMRAGKVQMVGKNLGKRRAMDQIKQIKFNGCGIVLRGVCEADNPAYVALVDIFIDGKKIKTMKLPADKTVRSNELFHCFDLEDGDHVLTMKRLNPADNVSSDVWTPIVYKKVK